MADETQDEVIHIPKTEEHIPGFGEIQTVAGGGITEEDAVPKMPPGSGMAEESDSQGGGLDASDMAQPTTTADATGDRATGLMGLRGG